RAHTVPFPVMRKKPALRSAEDSASDRKPSPRMTMAWCPGLPSKLARTTSNPCLPRSTHIVRPDAAIFFLPGSVAFVLQGYPGVEKGRGGGPPSLERALSAIGETARSSGIG